MVVAASHQDLTRVVSVVARLQSVDHQLERDLVTLQVLLHLVFGVAVDDRVVGFIQNDFVVFRNCRLRVFVDPVDLTM